MAHSLVELRIARPADHAVEITNHVEVVGRDSAIGCCGARLIGALHRALVGAPAHRGTTGRGRADLITDCVGATSQSAVTPRAVKRASTLLSTFNTTRTTGTGDCAILARFTDTVAAVATREYSLHPRTAIWRGTSVNHRYVGTAISITVALCSVLAPVCVINSPAVIANTTTSADTEKQRERHGGEIQSTSDSHCTRENKDQRDSSTISATYAHKLTS